MPIGSSLWKRFSGENYLLLEKNYVIIEKECLAIMWPIRKFRHYLIGAHFVIQTDHKPLEWLTSPKTIKAHLQHLERWSLELWAFDFDIVHLPRSTDLNANALSQRPKALGDTYVQPRKLTPLFLIYELVKRKGVPPQTGKWTQFPLKWYKQIWSQLTLQQSVLCKKVTSPTMNDSKHLIVVPQPFLKVSPWGFWLPRSGMNTIQI